MKRVTPAALRQPKESARLMAHRPTRVAAPAVTSIEQRLAIEHGATQALAESNSVAEAAPRIIRTVCETLQWACGSRWTLNDETGSLECAEAWGVPSATVGAFLDVTREVRQSRAPGGLVRRVWREGAPIWLPDVSREQSFQRAAAALKAGLHSAFAFPIKAGSEVISAMEFFGREIRQPDPELLECMRHVGSQIAQFMHRTKAEENLGRFRMAVDLSADAIFITDCETLRYIDVNDTACRTSGYTRAELLTKGPLDLLVTVSREQLKRSYEELIAQSPASLTSEMAGRTKSGSEAIVEVRRRALNVGGRWIEIAISRDITARTHAERARRRLQNMFAALGATNEAIIHSKSPEELYQRVCDAVVQGGKLITAAVMIPDEATGRALAAAVPGGGERRLRNTPISVDGTTAEGRGLVGTAYRSGQPCIINDFLNDARTQVWRAAAEKGSMRSGAGMPLVRNGRTIGVLLLISDAKDSFDEEIVKLLQRIADNVSFALDNFDRAAERLRADQALRESEARFRSLIALSSDWYWEQDEQYRLTFMSTTVQEKTGLDPSSYLGRKRWDEAALNLTEADWENHRAQLDRREPFRDFEMQRIGRDGNPVWLSLSGEPVFDEGGIFKGYRGVGSDITARKSSEDRIQYLATHDGLTGLPNRLMFGQLLSLELESARRYERGFAVLFIDLDRFKAVNDTLGHAFGDALLKEMAARLKEALRASDVVARLGGDEFVVLVQEVNDANQVAAVARKIMSALVRPIELSGQECRVTASIGICVYPGDARDEESLMKNADMAMYLAKEAGKNNYQFYSQEIQARSIDKLAMERQLRRGLERNELSISYQAKLDLRSDAITGVEALLRWTNPELGAVSPMRFIPVAEETGLIMPIGKWVLRTACAQNVAWQKQGLPPVRMAVNLSPRQFTDPDLLDDIGAALRETGMAPELLELEITEGMVMHDTARTIALLRAIKALGVRLAIDDFGTGYSSLAQLKRFPIDIIKVDRSFIRDIPADAEDMAITQAIIAMGRSLGLAVVAEGVETREQQAFLRRNGCEEMQGYFFSKPVAPEAFAELLQRHVPAI